MQHVAHGLDALGNFFRLLSDQRFGLFIAERRIADGIGHTVAGDTQRRRLTLPALRLRAGFFRLFALIFSQRLRIGLIEHLRICGRHEQDAFRLRLVAQPDGRGRQRQRRHHQQPHLTAVSGNQSVLDDREAACPDGARAAAGIAGARQMIIGVGDVVPAARFDIIEGDIEEIPARIIGLHGAVERSDLVIVALKQQIQRAGQAKPVLSLLCGAVCGR